MLSQQSQHLVLCTVQISLDGVFVLLPTVQLLLRLLALLLPQRFCKFVEGGLKLNGTLVQLLLIILEFLHEVVEPFRYLGQIAQSECLVHFLECILLPSTIDVLVFARPFEHFG